MSRAAEALLLAATESLDRVEGIGRVYDAPPIQAAFPHAIVTVDVESDWSHKSGKGRQIRIAATLHDKGERPLRLRRLTGAAEAELGRLGPELEGWRLVTMQHLRTRTVKESEGRWAGVIEFRARLLAG
jgi:hypothetical protein